MRSGGLFLLSLPSSTDSQRVAKVTQIDPSIDLAELHISEVGHYVLQRIATTESKTAADSR